MKWKLLLFVLLFGFQQAWAQRNIEDLEEPSFSDRLYFGGGGALQFSQNTFVIGASPLVGYMLTNRFSTGLSATYLFTRYGGIYNLNTHTYGGSTFARYNLFRSVFTMAEYEMLNFERVSLNSELPRQWVNRALLGGGYFQPTGPRGSFYIGILYDMLYRHGMDSPYNSPWVIRSGITF